MELLMSQRERDRLRVVALLAQEGRGGVLTQGQAAEQLRLSERHVRRLVAAYRREGDAAVVHKARGRPSNRKISDDRRGEVLGLLWAHYRDFGPTLAAEKLAERHGILLSRETLRQWMIQADLRKPRRRKAQHRAWRERKACFGELVQMDTSEHDWFEGRGEQVVLVSLIDDATSRARMRFFPTDTTAANMTLLGDWFRRFGRPLALYADKASHFRVNRDATLEEQLEDRGPETQIRRALRELGIEYIAAHSPQAKGRIERSFGVAQDRLVKELRLAHISDLEAANRFLEEAWLPFWDQRFTREPRSGANAHRSIKGLDLAAILSHQETRCVARDYTVQFQTVRYQITQRPRPPGLLAGKVVVELRLDGALHIRFRGRYLACAQLPPAPPRAAAPPLGLRPRSRAAAPSPSTPLPPAPDHPWRRPFSRTLLSCSQQDISTLR
jgi:transposase